MIIDKEDLVDEDEEGILRKLVERVTKSDEEIKEKRTRQGGDTDLKIYLADKNGFSLGDLEPLLQQLTERRNIRKEARDFVREHTFEEELLDEDISFVRIYTPGQERSDEFVFIDREKYVWILTTERSKWTKQTIEKVLKYLPELDRLYLSSEDLEDVVGGVVDSSVSGFTSKYHSPFSDRDATLRFHGAEEGDIETAKDSFGAEPTRIEFDQKNSPQTAIQGSNTNNGYATIESVREGSQDKAVRTLQNVLSDNEKHDSENYSIEREIIRQNLGNGCAVDGFTSVELTKKVSVPEGSQKEKLREKLEDNILSKQMYDHGCWGQDTFLVYDKTHEEVFEVGVEEPDLVVHAQEDTTEAGLRTFCENVIEEFDSAYDIVRKQMRTDEQTRSGS